MQGGHSAAQRRCHSLQRGVTIANSRVIAVNDAGFAVKWKEQGLEGQRCGKVMTLIGGEFTRRSLIHMVRAQDLLVLSEYRGQGDHVRSACCEKVRGGAKSA